MEETRVHVPGIEKAGGNKHVDGAETASPDTSAEETHPVKSPLNSSSSLESLKTEEKSHRRREADRYKDRLKSESAERKSRRASGAENGAQHCPVHPHTHGKNANKVSSGSPSSERKAGAVGRISNDSSTPGRSRMKSTDRHDQTTDQASAVPKFGGWNENDPSSGDGYTGIFDKVREEKNNAKKAPMIMTDPEFYPDYGARKSKGCSCFGWLRR